MHVCRHMDPVSRAKNPPKNIIEDFACPMSVHLSGHHLLVPFLLSEKKKKLYFALTLALRVMTDQTEVLE